MSGLVYRVVHLHCNDAWGQQIILVFWFVYLGRRSIARKLVRGNECSRRRYPIAVSATGVLYAGLSCPVFSDITHCLEPRESVAGFAAMVADQP